jgi:signal transduction histidine kinase
MRHDILNDLQVARSALDIYQDENDQEFLQKAASRLEQSVSLVNQVQELERVTTGRELQPYRIRAVIQDVMDADLNCCIDGDCTVQADAALHSVMDNLIENAIIHGGSEHIEITMQEHDDICEIRVADDGTGIPDEVKDHVFKERFSYGGSAGSGLGLYIVRKAIERYGGVVHIEDNQPTGTIVVIQLPKATS